MGLNIPNVTGLLQGWRNEQMTGGLTALEITEKKTIPPSQYMYLLLVLPCLPLKKLHGLAPSKLG